MTIHLPNLCLVTLIGSSGAGKSTFARRHFRPTEVLSSDFFRGLVSDDEADQSASGAAFELLHLTCAKRLQRGRLTVVDATNVQAESRKPLLILARKYHVVPVALVFALPPEVCDERDRQRPHRAVGPKVVRNHWNSLQRSLEQLEAEGFERVHVLSSPEEMDNVVITREPPPCDRTDRRGGFDLIGDVHGCFDELLDLLTLLGYGVAPRTDDDGRPTVALTPPAGRTLVFVGDLVDRGPRTPDVLRLVMGAVADGIALCVCGNHDDKLLRKLKGNDVKVAAGLAESLRQLDAEPPEFAERVRGFLDGLVSHYLLDGGGLVVAHAGLRGDLHGRTSKRVRDFALYGDVSGDVDEDGLPMRGDWATDYRGKATVVYGHTPVGELQWVNNTLNVDTGCVFGGRLTALRYPERECLSVPARRAYAEPKRRIVAPPPPT